MNYDPREVYVRGLFEERGEYNVFHQYYHALVHALFDAGVSRTVVRGTSAATQLYCGGLRVGTQSMNVNRFELVQQSPADSLYHPAHGRDRRPSSRTRHPAPAGAAVGAVGCPRAGAITSSTIRQC
ncbi:MAG: hypothetical protein ABI024_01930 [Vicinamibacterales bacterium]